MAAMKNMPAIWQDYLRKLINELKRVERELKSVTGADAFELHSRAQRLRNDISLLS
jgi:hypothetical protein